MRVVLDTNVLIAAFIARGVCADLYEYCALRHRMVCSEFIMEELGRVLRAKFDFTDEEALRVTSLVRERAEFVMPSPLAEPICRDPADDAIPATAAAGRAVCIISGDKDLLAVKAWNSIHIIPPGSFSTFEAGEMN
jgi:putative PIN family toxin of toxin-antitoxin system